MAAGGKDFRRPLRTLFISDPASALTHVDGQAGGIPSRIVRAICNRDQNSRPFDDEVAGLNAEG